MDFPFKTDIIALRLNEAERERYEVIIARALSRNQLARQSDINRELMGMASYGLLTAEDLEYFRGRSELPIANKTPIKKEVKDKHAKRRTS